MEEVVEWEHDYAQIVEDYNLGFENILTDKTDEVNRIEKQIKIQNPIKDHKCYTIRLGSDDKEKHKCVYACDICGKKFRNKRCSKICQKVSKDPCNKHYLCEICGNFFTYISSFIAHHNHKHAEQNLFLRQQRLLECTVCHKKFSTKWNLKIHMQSHFDIFPYLCEFCGKKFKKSDIFKIHLRVHTGVKPYCCTVCAKRFATKGMLNTHMRSHTGERPYACDLCERRYAGLTALRMHRRSNFFGQPVPPIKFPEYGQPEPPVKFPFHFDEKVTIKLEPLDIDWEEEDMTLLDLKVKMEEKKPTRKSRSSNSKMIRQYSCVICENIIRGKSNLINHYLIHKEDKIKSNMETIKQYGEEDFFRCCVCMKEFVTKEQLDKHGDFHMQRPFFCEKCNRSFKQTQNFLTHMESHHENIEMKCKNCNFSTTFKLAFDKHVKSHAREEYKCVECDKVFPARTWFIEHKNYHTGERPFSCEECGKCFPYSRYLTAHKKSMHPHCYFKEPTLNECRICQKRYSHKNSLRLHMKIHTGENTYLCDICGKSLSSTDKLQLHRRIHTGYKPYACTVCEKRFTKKDILTDHLRTHSGEKPFACETCGKCFSQRSPLTIHRRYHTGERPYVCHLCNKGFVSKGILGIHLKQGKH